MGLTALVAALALALTPVQFLQAHASGGGFSEAGTPDPALTSWSVLGLRAAGADAPGSLGYLQSHEASLQTITDVALVALAEEALGAAPTALRARLTAAEHPNGRIGETVNSTMWAVLALDAAPAATRRYLLAQQTRSGGFSWYAGGAVDSNDTAAALEAMRVLHVRGAPVARAVACLLRFQTSSGGFELTHDRGADAQSTAWAIQGLVAAGKRPPRSAFAYLATLKRADGSYRYSRTYAVTPVWVTAQVLAALAERPFPLS